MRTSPIAAPSTRWSTSRTTCFEPRPQPTAIDRRLRRCIAAIEGQRREPVGTSFHIHQLDGARLEAMVHLEEAGVRLEWIHGKGTCAITGEGVAILGVLEGTGDATVAEARGALALFGDRPLIERAAEIFAPSRAT